MGAWELIVVAAVGLACMVPLVVAAVVGIVIVSRSRSGKPTTTSGQPAPSPAIGQSSTPRDGGHAG